MCDYPITKVDASKFISDKVEEIKDNIAVEAKIVLFVDDIIYWETFGYPFDIELLIAGKIYVDSNKYISPDRILIKSEFDNNSCLIYKCYICKKDFKDYKIFDESNINKDINHLKNATDLCESKDFDDVENTELVILLKKFIKYQEENLTLSEIGDKTGCLHKVSIFENDVICFGYEDVSRHNALLKGIGRSLYENKEICLLGVCSSSRLTASFLHICKDAGIKCIVARGAITAYVYSYAKNNKIAVYGFAGNGRITKYL